MTVSCFLSKKEKEVELDINFTVEMNCMQINSGKVVMWLETDIRNELPLTLFDVTHPGLAAVKIDIYIYMCVLLLLNQLHTLTSETKTMRH